MNISKQEGAMILSAIDYVLKDFLRESDHFTEEQTDKIVGYLEDKQMSPTTIRNCYISTAQKIYKEIFPDDQEVQH